MCLCVSGTSRKYLVHGALIEAEILTSTLPHAFVQLNPVLSAGTLPKGVSTPPKWSGNVSIYFRNLQKIFGVWVLNRSWDIDLPAPQCICSIWPGFGWWCSTHGCVHTSQVVYKCSYMSQKLPNKCGARGFNRSWNIDLPTPHVFGQLGLVSGHQHSAIRCVNRSEVVQKCSYVSQETPKKFGAWGPNRNWDIDLHSPMYLLNLPQILGTGTLPTCVSIPPTGTLLSRSVLMCLRNLQNIGAWGPKRSWDIDLPAPQCICSTWPCFWVLVAWHQLPGAQYKNVFPQHGLDYGH